MHCCTIEGLGCAKAHPLLLLLSLLLLLLPPPNHPSHPSRQLDQQNALLRAKETAQMGVLRSYEDSLHFMGVLMSEMADDDYGHNSEDMSFLAAAMLDLQAMELLKQLSPPPGDPVTAPSSSSSPPHVSTPSSCGGGGQLCNVGVGGGGSTTSTTTTTTTTSSSGQAALQESSRSQRLWSCLTSDAVLTMRGISTRDLAGAVSVCGIRHAHDFKGCLYVYRRCCICHAKPCAAKS